MAIPVVSLKFFEDGAKLGLFKRTFDINLISAPFDILAVSVYPYSWFAYDGLLIRDNNGKLWFYADTQSAYHICTTWEKGKGVK